MKLVTVFAILTIGMSQTNDIYASQKSESFQQFDKTTIIKKKLSDAEKQISNGNYIAAEKILNSLLNIDSNNSRAKQLLGECKKGILKQKENERNAFSKACNQNNINALKDFIAKYPSSEYTSKAKDRINDYGLWQSAKNNNSVDSYNSYLNKSTILAYKNEAYDAINNIRAEKEWIICKTSDNETKLSQYISSYPRSSHVDEATFLINVIKGRNYYNSGNYTLAYSYLSTANKYKKLEGDSETYLRTLEDKNKYEDIIKSTNVTKVRQYLNGLTTTSHYYKSTSNHLALLLGKSLSGYSSEYDMNETLSLAKDESTKEIVSKYISNAKREKAYYKHQQKVYARKAWWKDRFTVGWNVLHFDYLDNIMTVGTGIRFRFGRWSDAVNLVFGAEYSYNMYTDTEANYEDEEDAFLTVSHQFEIPVGLRFNLFKVGSRCKLYLGCNADFGSNLSEGEYFSVNKQTFSIEPQIGFAGRSYDFGMYYKKYIGDKLLFKYTNDYDQRIGCFFTWYL